MNSWERAGWCGPSCGLASPRPCHRDAARRPLRPPSSRQRSTSTPIRLVITASLWRAVPPSGQPAIALTWFSNWLKRQASMVQWPELCTLGAISLTSRRGDPPSRWNISTHKHADMAERFGDFAGDAPRLERAIGVDASRNAADGENAVLVHVLDRIVEFERAVLAAHREDGDLALEGDECFEQCRLPARAPSAPPRLRPRCGPALVPCRHSRSAVSSGLPAAARGDSASRRLRSSCTSA